MALIARVLDRVLIGRPPGSTEARPLKRVVDPALETEGSARLPSPRHPKLHVERPPAEGAPTSAEG